MSLEMTLIVGPIDHIQTIAEHSLVTSNKDNTQPSENSNF
jgi:hypothetical protein